MKLIIPELPALDTEPDTELILTAAAGDEYDRRQAANVFFGRYARQLFGFCRQYKNTLGGEDVVCCLVLMTFQRAFEHADTFDDNGIVDDKYSRARTLRWLITIATNLMRDWLRSGSENSPLPLTRIANPNAQAEGQRVHGIDEIGGQRHVRLTDDAAQKIHDPTAIKKFIVNDDELVLTVSPEKKCIQEALATLTEREQEIILFSAQYSVDGKKLRLPSDILHGLCTNWKTTKANIRTIRKRAFNKIEAYVATNCQHLSNLSNN